MKLALILGVMYLLAPVQIHGKKEAAQTFSPLNLRLLGLTLGENTLGDVERRLGPSLAGSCSKEEDAAKMLCYVSSRADKTSVIFESGPSGGWSTLDGFKAISGKVGLRCGLRCQVARALGSNVHTDGGLRFGLTRHEVLSLLGKPATIKGGHYIFEWSSKIPMTKAEVAKFQGPVGEAYWTVDDRIEVTLGESGVVEFEVHHTVFN